MIDLGNTCGTRLADALAGDRSVLGEVARAAREVKKGGLPK